MVTWVVDWEQMKLGYLKCSWLRILEEIPWIYTNIRGRSHCPGSESERKRKKEIEKNRKKVSRERVERYEEHPSHRTSNHLFQNER